ncbi:DUF1526 domain-containing protein [[Actinomadura] parvosata subsp. kistnae]|uniref:CAAX protease n=1 Tax=[Actinomadura] parvosata subsp. kistnae TaxID=1909395 RepID=A0A1V0AFE8_9ACTN|nr:hypothetical protein [Nonomuraea sp. ATCC 55076]AQZ68812.1 hypothetical protein BKM31_51625 [Nonomuraea sp. ATCC 55076]SPL92672.1 DUF1526 domain-containing protein [Actinomadura parvosata subsp. kistnae]
MDQREAKRLRDLLSQARLGEYEAHCGGDTVAALRLFCWNTEVAAAFYGPLQVLELTLRSVVDERMRELFGREDWWGHPRVNLLAGHQARIAEAHRKLRGQGIPAGPREIVGELSLGFWVGLLGRGRSYDQRFWRTSLYRGFPGHRGARGPLHQELDYLRVLRNKIAHHCPIHHRHLDADHDTILRVLGHMDPALAALVGGYSSVPLVLARRPSTA